MLISASQQIIRPTGQQAALQGRRRTIQSVQPALRLLRVLTWLTPSDIAPTVGEVSLTEKTRIIAFIEPVRGE